MSSYNFLSTVEFCKLRRVVGNLKSSNAGLVLSQSLANIVAIANLMPYLMDVMEEKLPKAAATAIIRMGITAIMAIGGSYLSDAYIGRYNTVLCSTIIYVTGLSLLAVAASPKHSSRHIITFQIGLFLIACGKAGQSPMLKDFGADQLKSGREEDNDYEIKKRVAIWWCMGATMGAFVGIILLLVAEGNQRWNLVYGLLAVTMSLAIGMFISGKPFYRYVEPCGSVLSCVSHVFVAAFLNRHLEFPLNVSQFNHGSGNELLPHTDGLRFLDKAAIMESLSTDPTEQENKWRHRTVTEVEETKLLIRMLPMWTTFLLYGLVNSLGSTFFLQQGSNMNRRLHHFKVPLPLFLLFTRYVSGQITWLNMRLSKNFPTLKQVMNPTRRIGIGMLFGVLCCSVASSVEAKRLNIVKQYNRQNKPKDTLPISVFWLLPQFLLLGAMDGFTYPGVKDFFYDQVPKSMRNFGPSFTASMMGVGSLLSVVVIAVIDKITSQGGRPSWFADTTNKSRLDYYYQTLTVLSYINLIFYAFVASKYTYTTPNAGNEPNVNIGDTMSF
ncbi:hypothetical protein AQUCO_01100180v1 [Aquilegia coerulea]|uniref:Major facilitator superfamily (MFS) profile domain-containing protein n=1 Tax=Aquilegia coerulea TaxID=218851 RepID=A0A2G5E5X7_AQUCA|nr:hypothetical protein AQUCO_01100180v1 [Aquilegia coerulea]